MQFSKKALTRTSRAQLLAVCIFHGQVCTRFKIVHSSCNYLKHMTLSITHTVFINIAVCRALNMETVSEMAPFIALEKDIFKCNENIFIYVKIPKGVFPAISYK